MTSQWTFWSQIGSENQPCPAGSPIREHNSDDWTETFHLWLTDLIRRGPNCWPAPKKWGSQISAVLCWPTRHPRNLGTFSSWCCTICPQFGAQLHRSHLSLSGGWRTFFKTEPQRGVPFWFSAPEIEAPVEQSWRKTPGQGKISRSDLEFHLPKIQSPAKKSGSLKIGKSLATKAVNRRWLAKNPNFPEPKTWVSAATFGTMPTWCFAGAGNLAISHGPQRCLSTSCNLLGALDLHFRLGDCRWVHQPKTFI